MLSRPVQRRLGLGATGFKAREVGLGLAADGAEVGVDLAGSGDGTGSEVRHRHDDGEADSRLDLLVESIVGKDVVEENIRHDIPLRHDEHVQLRNGRLQLPRLPHQHPRRIRLPLRIRKRAPFHHIHHRPTAKHIPRRCILGLREGSRGEDHGAVGLLQEGERARFVGDLALDLPEGEWMSEMIARFEAGGRTWSYASWAALYACSAWSSSGWSAIGLAASRGQLFPTYWASARQRPSRKAS